jgi:uncharacterized membrane protein
MIKKILVSSLLFISILLSANVADIGVNRLINSKGSNTAYAAQWPGTRSYSYSFGRSQWSFGRWNHWHFGRGFSFIPFFAWGAIKGIIKLFIIIAVIYFIFRRVRRF